jgi:CHAT domain-containing protein/Flp pilus assembly protein TadD
MIVSLFGTAFVQSAFSQQTLEDAERLNDQVLQLYAQGKYAEAVPLAEQALEIRNRLLRPDHKDVATSLNNLAGLYRLTGQYDKAESSYIKGLKIIEITMGENHPYYAIALNNLGDLYESLGRYEKAESLYIRSIEIMKTAQAEDHPDYAMILGNLAVLYKVTGQYKKAEPLYIRSSEIMKTARGEDHPDYAKALNNMAGLYSSIGLDEKAESLYLRSLEIKKHALGENHPDYAISQNNLAMLYKSRGQYDKAERLLLQSLETKRNTVGQNHPSYGIGLSNIGELYYEIGQYNKAESNCLQSSELLKITLGENHPNYGKSLISLAELYHATGQYDKAERLLLKSLEIIKHTLGENHLSYARNLNDLAILYGYTGQYDKAEQLLLQTIKIRREVWGENNSGYAMGLNNLAGLYYEIGQYDKIKQLLIKSSEIIKHTLGENNPDYALSLNNLANMYISIGQPEVAEPLLIKSLEIWKEVLGENHPYYATSLNNLAGLYSKTDRNEKAEPLLLQSLKIRKEILGENHPDYATSLSSLAALYYSMGQYERAENLCIEAKDIIKQSLGENHPDYATSLNNLAVLYLATSRPDKALLAIVQSMRIQQTNIARVFGFSSESDMRAYLATISISLDMLINLCASNQGITSDAAQVALSWVLRRKAIILNSLIEFRQAERLFQRDAKFAALKVRYQYLSQQLSNLPLKRLETLTATAHAELQQQLTNFRLEREGLQSELNRMLSAQLLNQPAHDIDVGSLKQRLSPGTVLIEFVRANILDFKATGKQPHHKPAHYFAFVLAADNTATQMIDLGAAKVIDDAISATRNSIIEFGEKWQIDKPGLLNEAAQEKEYRKRAKRLYDLIFAPVRERLGASKTIYIAPDHQLSLIPFEALVDASNKYLIENYRFAYLTSGRDLLRERQVKSQGTAIFADPDYDLKPDARAMKVKKLLAQFGAAPATEATDPFPQQLTRSGKLTPQLRGRQTRGEKWERRKATLKEAEDIELEMKATPYSPIQKYVNDGALEEVFKQIKPPRLLHVSTHGFFPAEGEDSNRPRLTSDEDAGNIALIGQERLRRASIENPLLSCGLVLAGANTIKENDGQAGGDDGWVTAEEIALMNLQGTELVVLSTCGSGLGKVSAGEGVYGLRRAFQNAGARTIVSTLFSVPDEESRELMKKFYEGLKTGRGKLESLRGAQLMLIETRRSKEGAAHPFFWASFVLAGDPE